MTRRSDATIVVPVDSAMKQMTRSVIMLIASMGFDPPSPVQFMVGAVRFHSAIECVCVLAPVAPTAQRVVARNHGSFALLAHVTPLTL